MILGRFGLKDPRSFRFILPRKCKLYRSPLSFILLIVSVLYLLAMEVFIALHNVRFGERCTADPTPRMLQINQAISVSYHAMWENACFDRRIKLDA